MMQEAAIAIGITFYNLKIYSTRFIGHQRRGLTSLLETWPAIVLAYESYIADNQNLSTARAKVTDPLKNFHSYNFFVTVEVHLDLLKFMVPVSKIFETNNLLPHQILPTISSTLMTLEMKVGKIGNEDQFSEIYFCCYKVVAVFMVILFLVNLFVWGKKGKNSRNQNLFEVTVLKKK